MAPLTPAGTRGNERIQVSDRTLEAPAGASHHGQQQSAPDAGATSRRGRYPRTAEPPGQMVQEVHVDVTPWTRRVKHAWRVAGGGLGRR